MMPIIQISRTEHDAASPRAVAGRMHEAAVAHRLLAIGLMLEDSSRADAARRCGMDRPMLRDWVSRTNADGVAGPVDRHAHAGPPHLLSPEQEAEVTALVLQGPDRAGHRLVRWRRVDLAGC